MVRVCVCVCVCVDVSPSWGHARVDRDTVVRIFADKGFEFEHTADDVVGMCRIV